jgi:hypothetical protein
MVGAVQDRSEIAVAAVLGDEADPPASAAPAIGDRPPGSTPVPGLTGVTDRLAGPLGERSVYGW